VELLAVIRASAALAEKRASLRAGDPREASMRERQALMDFGAFSRVKQAGLEETLSLAKRPLAWGLGLGLPALGVGHALISDAHSHAKDLVRDARNQALLTAAGVGGMQSLGGLLQAAVRPRPGPGLEQADPGQRLAADMRVDDLLEDACRTGQPSEKHAALVHLIGHRLDAMSVVRRIVP
jgi:hypothetical protein